MRVRPDQIVLVGLPGAGKSTIGPLLAGRLGWRYIDFDERIEQDSGRSVAEIFGRQGEAAFRQMEAELTTRLASESRVVLSPGGGWIVHHALPGALTVWLRVTPEEAVARMGRDAHARPLLQADPLGRLNELLAQREHHYMRADIAIDTAGKSPDVVALEVAAAVENYGKEE